VKVGGSRLIGADIRLVTASNRDLRRAVDDGSFREDLYYRISVAEDDGGAFFRIRSGIPLRDVEREAYAERGVDARVS
jgi:sigma54-dependent transcription regulator